MTSIKIQYENDLITSDEDIEISFRMTRPRQVVLSIVRRHLSVAERAELSVDLQTGHSEAV